MKIFTIGKPKKASLSLSLNAIVILILAIAMLGLGLAFIRGIFQQAESQVRRIADIKLLTNPPTGDQPVTLSPSTLEVKSGRSTEKIEIAFLNIHGEGDYLLKVYPTGSELDDLKALDTSVTECKSGGNSMDDGGKIGCDLNAMWDTSEQHINKEDVVAWTMPVLPKLPLGITASTLRMYAIKICESVLDKWEGD